MENVHHKRPTSCGTAVYKLTRKLDSDEAWQNVHTTHHRQLHDVCFVAERTERCEEEGDICVVKQQKKEGRRMRRTRDSGATEEYKVMDRTPDLASPGNRMW
jgi:hypothetical protein